MSEITDTQGGCYFAAPSRRMRFWRWCGFRFHLGDDEQKPDVAWKGWMQTRSCMHLTFADRLRILISGKLILQHTYDLDTPSPDKMFTRFDWHILPPGDRFENH